MINDRKTNRIARENGEMMSRLDSEKKKMGGDFLKWDFFNTHGRIAD